MIKRAEGWQHCCWEHFSIRMKERSSWSTAVLTLTLTLSIVAVTRYLDATQDTEASLRRSYVPNGPRNRLASPRMDDSINNTETEDYSDVPMPNGVLNKKISDAIRGANHTGKVRNECITIVQVFDGVEFEGISGKDLVRLATRKETRSKAAYLLGIVTMYLYAQRHGHGYRIVGLNSTGADGIKLGVFFGGGRPNRHPAWGRVPLLWNLYTSGPGSERMLGAGIDPSTGLPSTTGPQCPYTDQWVLYVDTDIVVTAASDSVGSIFAGLSQARLTKNGLPCNEAFSKQTFTDDSRTPIERDYCYNHQDILATPFSQGINPDEPVALVGFNDASNWKCPIEQIDRVKGECPDTYTDLNSAILMWRVKKPGSQKPVYSSPIASQAIEAGKNMVDAWRRARVARPKPGTPNVDTEAFQAVTWDRKSESRERHVYNPNSNVAKCSIAMCGFAGDQPILNNAVIYGLPHQPYNYSHAPQNAGIGRFLKNIAIYECKMCYRDFAYNAGEAFFHGTSWKYKPPHIGAWMMKLAWELYGLDFVFRYDSIASKTEGEFGSKSFHSLRHHDTEKEKMFAERLAKCKDIDFDSNGCIDREHEQNSEAKFNSALITILNHHLVILNLSPESKGVDSSTVWYQVDWNVG